MPTETVGLGVLVLLKSFPAAIDPAKPVGDQVNMMTFGNMFVDNNALSSADAEPTSTDPLEQANAAYNHFNLMKQYLQHAFLPVLNPQLENGVDTAGALRQPFGGENSDKLNNVNKCVRDLELSLVQIQGGDGIVRPVFSTCAELVTASSQTSADVLQSMLEKYNPSNVDQLFGTFNPSLAQLMAEQAESRDHFVNEVHKFAKQWPLEISKVVQLMELPIPVSNPDNFVNIESEVGFWKELEKVLVDTKEQLLSNPTILLTKLVLKRTNRVSEQLIYEAEMHLDKAMSAVQGCVTFTKDFTIMAEISKVSVGLHPQLSRLITSTLQQLSKYRFHSKYYDFKRVMSLFEMIGSAIYQQLTVVLRNKNLFQCNYSEFTSLCDDADEVFVVWQSEFVQIKTMLKDVAQRNNKSEKVRAFVFSFEALQQRLRSVKEFRENHERMVKVSTSVLGSGHNSQFDDAEQSKSAHNVILELDEAYGFVIRSTADILDITPTGEAVWLNVKQGYEKRLEHIDESICTMLTASLDNCRSADEMFRVFSVYNPLFFRTSIKQAVNSSRTRLVKNVREDVLKLREKFKSRYDVSQEKITADLRDVPPLSGSILWARQIEKQFSTLMKRMEDLLGKGWESHVEGKQLKEICDELRSNLDTDSLYKDWVSVQLKSDAIVSQKMFNPKLDKMLFVVEYDPVSNAKCIRVNFDNRHVVLFKEIHCLEWLLPSINSIHKTIPGTLRDVAKKASARYAVAMALQSGLSCISQTSELIDDEVAVLVTSYAQALRESIMEAFKEVNIGQAANSLPPVDFESPPGYLNDWIQVFSQKVNNLQERVANAIRIFEQIKGHLDQLATCEYNRETFLGIFNSMQLLVDGMQTKGYSNIQKWTDDLHVKIEAILKQRLHDAVLVWVSSFSAAGRNFTSSDSLALESNSSALESNEAASAGTIAMDLTVHEIALSNQCLYVSPAIETSRTRWIKSFHDYMGIACKIPRISTSRYQVFNSDQSTDSPTLKDFSHVLQMVEPAVLRQPFEAIETEINNASVFGKQWLQYQTLWDVSVTHVTDTLGRDIVKWQQLLTDIKIARSTIDSNEEEQFFGPVVINYRQVQNKVNMKYDSWQKDCQARFGALLLEEMKSTYDDFVALKTKLEGIRFDEAVATSEVIVGVELLRQAKNTLSNRKAYASHLESGEKLLTKQRFQFPKEWVYISNILAVLSDVQQIHDRRNASVENQLPVLQAKIYEEDQQISKRVGKMQAGWEAQRPIDGDITPVVALQALTMFSSQLAILQEEVRRISDAKSAIGLESATGSQAASFNDVTVTTIGEEIADLRSVWGIVAPTWERVEELRGALLLKEGVSPPAIRKQLDGFMGEMRNMPSKVRSYAAYEHLQTRLTKYLSHQTLLRDICSDSLKERHWKILIKNLSLPVTNHLYYAAELTLGMVWDSPALAQKKMVGEIMMTAQGEQALQQFIKEMKDFWNTCELTLVARDGGVRIIAGWDVLFTMLEDHLNSLSSLKQSPYFRNVQEFQEDTSTWEVKLTNLRSIFEIWIEVQRKWVYLRGIFKNPDIKAQLPAQYSKYKSVDNEFSSLLKKVSMKPSVVDLLLFDNLSRQLERQDGAMSMIQKALGEYLEKQRQMFPRFYFVNNDDLVEILGNGNEPGKILSHLGKMFAGISSISMTTSEVEEKPGSVTKQTVATSMTSKDAEVVALLKPIVISAGNIKEWLAELESNMIITLASLLQSSIRLRASSSTATIDTANYIGWVNSFPVQVIGLCSNVMWTDHAETAMNESVSKSGAVGAVLAQTEEQLRVLSEHVLGDVDIVLRKKCEQLITAFVHQRDVIRLLVQDNVGDRSDFKWLYHLRFYWTNASTKGSTSSSELIQKLNIKMSNFASFYGFEYLGIGERLVQTPLTDRCYLTLTQALHFRMGGNPFGPAGTGKTESVKMLGSELGRFVLVFNCDENFDYAAMGRIFAGLCQVGAWGCFDEFNRLEERILSAVSQQILTIQRGLMAQMSQIELLGNPCNLHKDVGIFVTMNPGYAGRSNLPDNLKQLFRGVAMTTPDRKMIAQVMLFSQGIVSAEELARKIVLLFTLCEEQLSAQSHYDFGLRALKSVLCGAGDLKRRAIAQKDLSDLDGSLGDTERNVLILSLVNNISPKLVPEDITLFTSLLQSVFPNTELPSTHEPKLVAALKDICASEFLEVGDKWLEKVLQLKQVLEMRHGVMMVGPSGSGKSSAWRCLLKGLQRVDGVKGDYYVIDPKAMKKDKLYGHLDPNTLEWTDGVFTKILRKIIENNNNRGSAAAPEAASSTNNSPAKGAPGGEATAPVVSNGRRSWIIFDGDVDPEWAENLNSVLDDNKILTLPTGDRLKLPNNLKIMMEVESLKHATMATVSRCGMVWFSEEVVTVDMALQQQMNCLRYGVVLGKVNSNGHAMSVSVNARLSKEEADVRSKFVDNITPFMKASPDLVGISLDYALNKTHIMEPNRGRLLVTLHSMLTRGILAIMEHNDSNPDFPASDEHLSLFTSKWLLYSLLWSFGGSMSWNNRCDLAALLASHSTVDLPNKTTLMDVQVNVQDGSWDEWNASVPLTELDAHKVVAHDVVVTTTDTVRHTEVMSAWLSSHQPLILCGPPGSGKTMTLTAVIDTRPEFVLATLNFSSGTSPDIILKVFAQYCEVVESPDGLIMQPTRQSYSEDKWLIIFCDEINLPALDKYGTQSVLMFMRQLAEQGGFWRSSDCKWIKLRRIQFVGACNAPTDAGRVSLSHRFMRHAPLLMVDYPAETSLKQIYKSFNSALLKLHPNLKSAVDPLTDAMVEFYVSNQRKFTVDAAPQYIYSPRELSRWVRGMYEAMEPLEVMTMQELVRLWGHEALRLFQDRLMTDAERQWCDSTLNAVASKYFTGVDTEQALQRPILFSNWLSKTYQSTKLEDFYHYVSARLKVFYEEELDVPLVLFDDVISHVLRIDNVLRHPMGHMLLVGDSGVGKTVLTKFVAWINGLKIFQIKANNRYTLEQFDEDIRGVLRRVALEGEKICFIFDEGNVLSSAFLERMNSLLASGEVPGLFQGEDLSQLMVSCREVFLSRDGLILDSTDEIWRHFTKLIQRNLHVVLTMNPASSDFENRCTTSPALFNRCVVDWFGTWSQSGLTQVAHEFTKGLDTGYTDYSAPTLAKTPASLSLVMEVAHASDREVKRKAVAAAPVRVTRSTRSAAKQVEAAPEPEGPEVPSTPTLHNAVVAGLVDTHNTVYALTQRIAKSASARSYYVSPRDALDLIKKFMSVEQEKRAYLEEQQTHVRAGLNKLKETQEQVGIMQAEMKTKEIALKNKDTEANQKLVLMLEKQKEAESRKSTAEKLTVTLNEKHEIIRVRKESVQSELAEAEPSLIAAKHSVQNIRKAQLDELRALSRPPKSVQLCLETVVLMISGEKTSDWSDMRKLIRKDDFISTVVNFDPLLLTQKQVKTIQEDYLAQPQFDYDSVDRASKACGPLYQWAESQIKYAVILRRVKPLRDEVERLETESNELEASQKQAVEEVAQLEDILATYKLEYAAAIRETEIIRAEMELVVKKVSRAESLLASLNEERDRWQETWTNFDAQMSTLIGDCMLSAAFLTYAGGFDQSTRRSMFNDWSDILHTLKIPYRADMDIISYLSLPSEQLSWSSDYGLATDELAMQNAILLQRYSRFPLVIDPSGQAISFLLKKFASQKIIQSSFLDSSFLKTLASSIRFGTPLLVHDVENVDPILNPVLNKEFQKTGGRTLVRLGNEDVDFSPKFMVILLTRNPMAKFAPDLCSRVTIVNFTITHSSLESQVLSTILKSERPDVDAKRTEVIRLQGEQQVKLRDLEDQLLNKISAIQGAILDDDSIINTLETIKREASDLNREVAKTEQLLVELKTIAKVYEPLAVIVATIYFTLEKLTEVDYFYQFSLQYYMDIVQKVLAASSTPSAASTTVGADGNTGYAVVDVKVARERLLLLTRTLFHEVCRRVLRGLKHEDKTLFTSRLAQISIQQLRQQSSQRSEELLLTEAEYTVLYGNYLPSSADTKKAAVVKNILPGFELDEGTARNICGLMSLPSFSGLQAHMSEAADSWKVFLESSAPEDYMPAGCVQSGSHMELPDTRECLLRLLIIRACRPDRILQMVDKFITVALGKNEAGTGCFDWQKYCSLNLREIAAGEEGASFNMPIMLCSSETGQDVSNKIDALALAGENRDRVSLLQVAMGSNEGYAEADRILALGMKQSRGSKTVMWVLLKNIHLCSVEWLELLEKKLHGSGEHSGSNGATFRLFLTCEMSPSIPVSLLRACDIVIIEPSTGIKANLQRFLQAVPAERMDRQPAERSRLYSLLGWLNAVVYERLRYLPYGWTKKYEFSDIDAQCALNMIDEWVDLAAGTKAHIAPEKLPWNAIRKLLLETLYGGRIDNSFDYAVLDSFIHSVFRPEMFSSNTALVSLPDGGGGAGAMEEEDGAPSGHASSLMLPERLGREALDKWVALLPSSNPPTWIGLPLSAEMERKQALGMKLLATLDSLTKSALVTVQTSEAPASTDVSDAESGISTTHSNIMKICDKWLCSMLPPADAVTKCNAIVALKSADTAVSVVDRFILRELSRAAHMITFIRTDIDYLK